MFQPCRFCVLFRSRRRSSFGNEQGETTQLAIESFGTSSQPVDLGWASTSEEAVLAYIHAVGDGLPIYLESGLAPPLYCVALALGQMLQRTELPPGAIHSTQEFNVLKPVTMGGNVRTLAWLERQREQRGLRFLTFGIKVLDGDDQGVLAVKTMLLVPRLQPGHEVPDPPPPASGLAGGSQRETAGSLRPVHRKIRQDHLSLYSEVSGDHNPLHLDPEFAAATQFGGIIAHGMLTLAYVSEMMAATLGVSWLESGSMRARFRGAAYPGDNVETWGTLGKSDEGMDTYAVGLINRDTGADLITGTAVVKRNGDRS